MSLPFTSVVSYHTNPMTCGVAKFSAELAKRLGVPFVGFDQKWVLHPLLSLKLSELSDQHRANLVGRLIRLRADSGAFSLFWHDEGTDFYRTPSAHATHVFYADPSLGSPGLWCPSLITPRPRPVRLFSFGMAHKLQTDKYQRVRELLDAAGKRYHLRVSVGLHEGTDLSDATQHFDALKDIMGEDNVTILGILSDDAVVEELSRADYVLAFFDRGVRDNNTTVHAALAYGKRVITNHDGLTGYEMRRRTINLLDWSVWPSTELWTWDQLISAMRKECDKSRLAPAK